MDIKKFLITVSFVGAYLFLVFRIYGNHSHIFIFGTFIGIAIMGLISEAKDREKRDKKMEEEINIKNHKG